MNCFDVFRSRGHWLSIKEVRGFLNGMSRNRISRNPRSRVAQAGSTASSMDLEQGIIDDQVVKRSIRFRRCCPSILI